MPELLRFPEFAAHQSALKDTSKDKHEPNNSTYMTESNKTAVNFDAVKDDYVKKMRLSEMLASCDALFEDGEGAIIFTEFKNGALKKNKQSDLRKKIYDSVLIFMDITLMNLREMRQKAKYILVYNETANKENKDDAELIKKQTNEVQPSGEFDLIAKTFSKWGKKEYVCFGLKKFQNYCFKEVHTYTEKEFESYMELLESIPIPSESI